MKMRFIAFIVVQKSGVEKKKQQHECRTYFTIRNELYLYVFDGLVCLCVCVYACVRILIPITKSYLSVT